MAGAIGHLNNGTATVKFELIPRLNMAICLPVRISDKVASIIMDHDPLVERVILEGSILPSLLLALQIVGEETDKVEDGGRCWRTPWRRGFASRIRHGVSSSMTTSGARRMCVAREMSEQAK